MPWWFNHPSLLLHAKLDSPVNQVETVALPCIFIGDLNSASCAASVAQLVELQPRMLTVVGSSPTRGGNFSLKGCCLGIYFCLVFLTCLSIYHVHLKQEDLKQ